MRKISKYKPKGWTGESHRHYLAAKGISTRKKKYMASSFLGNALEGEFRVRDAQRKRVALEAGTPIAQREAIQQAQFSALSPEEQKTKKEFLEGLGIGKQLTDSTLQSFWTREIGNDSVTSAKAAIGEVEDVIAKLKEERVAFSTEEATPEKIKEFNLRADLANNSLKQLKQDVADARYVVNINNKLENGEHITPSQRGKLAKLKSKQVRIHNARKEFAEANI